MCVVFIEFMVFDLFINFFSVVFYIYEVLFLGGVVMFKRINMMLLYGVMGKCFFSVVCELIVFFMVFYFIIVEVVKIWKEKCFYFKFVWVYVEMV